MNTLVFILVSAAVVASAFVGVMSSMSAGAVLIWCGMLVMVAVLVVRSSVRNAGSDSRMSMEIALDLAALREMHEAAGQTSDRPGAHRI